MISGGAMAQPVAVPEIEIVPTGSGYEISGRVRGVTDGVLKAELEIVRVGPAGEMRIAQGDEVTVGAGEVVTLGQSSISAGAASSLHVTLVILRDGETVAVAETRIGPPIE